MNNLTQIYNRLIELRKIKSYAFRNNKDNLALFCDNQIRLINRINISLVG